MSSILVHRCTSVCDRPGDRRAASVPRVDKGKTFATTEPSRPDLFTKESSFLPDESSQQSMRDSSGASTGVCRHLERTGAGAA